jgi:hypothetical protein
MAMTEAGSVPELGKCLNAERISSEQAPRFALSRAFCHRFLVSRFSLQRDGCRIHQSPSGHRYQVGGGSGTDHAKSHTLKEISITGGLEIGVALNFWCCFIVLRSFHGGVLTEESNWIRVARPGWFRRRRIATDASFA